jgi:hypothetical protein
MEIFSSLWRVFLILWRKTLHTVNIYDILEMFSYLGTLKGMSGNIDSRFWNKFGDFDNSQGISFSVETFSPSWN